MLQQLVADQSLHARSGTAFAVTPKLRESYAEGDDDELAEVALREAALASLRLLAGEGMSGLPPRRAVVEAEVEGATARPDLDDSVVRLAGQVAFGDVIAAYVDNADAVFDRAVKAGCTIRMPMSDMFWGDRYGSLVDPFGHAWSVATHKEDVAPGEMEKRAQDFYTQQAKQKKVA